MKKRAGLTEKELAIGMWLYIKEYIKHHEDPERPNYFIKQIKLRYLMGHKFRTASEWPSYCILCYKYWKDCSKCPLGSCSNDHKSLWSVVTNSLYDDNVKAYISPFTLEERLEACDKIIEAIEKDIPDEWNTSPKHITVHFEEGI